MASYTENMYDLEALKSPVGRTYFHFKPEEIINCTMGLKHPIDLEALKVAISNTIMIKHPRFCSLVVRDRDGREYWKRTHVDIDDHIIVHHHVDVGGEEEKDEAINEYLAQLAHSALLNREKKPLWELHVLLELKCLVLRVHHALGDAPSVMSMLSVCFGPSNNENATDNNGARGECYGVENGRSKRTNWEQIKGIWSFFKSIWFTCVFVLRVSAKLLWMKDKASALNGGLHGVEIWPRKIATAKFKLEDFKAIKKSIPHVTLNDVLLGIVSSGISKYLDPIKSRNGLQITGVVPVNLRKNPELLDMREVMKCVPSSWGNRIGSYLIPVSCRSEQHPLDRAKAMKAIMDKKKQSYEAKVLYYVMKLIASFLGVKMATWCFRRLLCHSTFIFSNIKGPSAEMSIANNPVTFLRVNVSSGPQAMLMHMVSYAGKAELQLMVTRDVIPNPQFLTNCFQESLREMRNCI